MARCRLARWSLTLTVTKLQSRLFLSLKAPDEVFVFLCVFVSSWCYFVDPYRYNKRIHEITRKPRVCYELSAANLFQTIASSWWRLALDSTLRFRSSLL